MSGDSESNVETLPGESVPKVMIKATGVFWDLMDLPIPLGVSPFSVHDNVKSALVDRNLPVDWVSFWLYVDKQMFSDEMVDCFKDAGMTFELRSEIAKDQRAWKMLRDIHVWTIANPLSTSLVGTLAIVSSNFSPRRRHVSCLQSLQAKGYNVLLIQLEELTSPTGVPTENLEWLWHVMFRVPEKPFCPCAGKFHKLQRTYVFWDLVDYPVPTDVDFCTATKNIELSLEAQDYLGKISFLLYFENQPMSDEKMKFYEDAQKMFFYHEGDKFKRVNKMFLDTITCSMEYSVNNPRIPTNVVLVSKNIPDEPRFVHVLNKLRSICYNVVVIHPEEEPSLPMLSTLPPIWLSQSARGEKPIVTPCDSCHECISRIEMIEEVGEFI